MKSLRWAVLGALFCAASLCAQTVKDTALAALIETGRYADAERAATARIASKPDDMDGYAALTLSVLNGNDSAHHESAQIGRAHV